jgi:hypothetical protein
MLPAQAGTKTHSLPAITAADVHKHTLVLQTSLMLKESKFQTPKAASN